MGAFQWFLFMSFLSGILIPIAVAGGCKRAAYFLDNDPKGSSVVSLRISSKDGTLSKPTRTPTGGYGLLGLLTPPPSVPPVAGSLFTSDSVVVTDHYLFTLNVGSHTVAVFAIDKKNPCRLTLLGAPQDTLGEFPVSVAYSSKLKTACVFNGGKVNGVTCFRVDHAAGLIPLDKYPRNTALNQTTPAIALYTTASDVVFNPSSTALVAVIKGYPGAGLFYVWPVVNGKVSYDPIISAIGSLAFPFSGQFLGSDSDLLVSDSSFGSVVLQISAEFLVSVKTRTVIPYNVAACWTAWSPKFPSAYIIDAAQPNITAVDIKTGAITKTIHFTSIAPPGFNFSAGDVKQGGDDAKIDRQWLYVLGGDASVIVIDLQSSAQVQRLDLSSLGTRVGWTGMAVYPTSSKQGAC